MKLTAADKDLLLEWDYEEKYFWQIEEAMKEEYTTYKLYGVNDEDARVISREEAIKLLGRESYLSGISRSAFHWSALCIAHNKGDVAFNSSALFK